jgi:hypothetical protein
MKSCFSVYFFSKTTQQIYIIFDIALKFLEEFHLDSLRYETTDKSAGRMWPFSMFYAARHSSPIIHDVLPPNVSVVINSKF